MYGKTGGVSSLVPAMGAISSSSTPTDGQITIWLVQASAQIDRTLGNAGYSVPVGQATTLAVELGSLAELYAAANVVMARGLDTVAGTDENRSGQWLAEYRRRLDDLPRTDLTAVGATRTATPKRRARVRSLQMRRVDAFSGAYAGDVTEYDDTSE